MSYQISLKEFCKAPLYADLMLWSSGAKLAKGLELLCCHILSWREKLFDNIELILKLQNIIDAEKRRLNCDEISSWML